MAGKAVKIKDYFEPARGQVGCVDSGVQVYAEDAGLTMSYFADTSSVEQVFFIGNQVEGFGLSPNDSFYPISAQGALCCDC